MLLLKQELKRISAAHSSKELQTQFHGLEGCRLVPVKSQAVFDF